VVNYSDLVTEAFAMSPPSLTAALAYWEEAFRAGQDLSPAELLPARPDLHAALAQAIAILRDVTIREGRKGAAGPLVYPETSPVDPNPQAPPGYQIERELGRGGMGVVYLARQTALKRLVALKMIRAGREADPEERARFQKEAEAVGRLNHPHIVQVFEVGQHRGQPFMALEYCPGGSLAGKLASEPLEPRASAQLVRTLALAIQAAHVARLLHRDLKPSNILLAADGVPKVTDFGLAKVLEASPGREAGSDLTLTGVIIGTPSFMAPEQARGDKDLGPTVDIYSLGAILYACLTGRPPFRAATSFETVHQALTTDPVPVRQLQPEVARDLETICLKCLQKDPARRYASAQELADDLERFLNGEPIRARPLGVLARCVRWCRRNPVVALLATTAVLLLIAGTVVASAFARLWNERASAAQANYETAQREKKEVLRQQALVAEKLHQFRHSAYTLQLQQVGNLWQLNTRAARSLLDDERTCPEEFRDFTWHLYDQAVNLRRFVLPGHSGRVGSLTMAPNGRYLATADAAGVVRLWDPATGAELGKAAAATGPIQRILVAPDASVLLTVGGPPPGGAEPQLEGKLWDVLPDAGVPRDGGGAPRDPPALTLRERATLPGATKVAAFHPTGRFLAVAHTDKVLRLWEVRTGKEATQLADLKDTLQSLAFAAGGTVLVAGGTTAPEGNPAAWRPNVLLWDVKETPDAITLTARPPLVGEGPALAVSVDGKLLATSRGAGEGVLRDAASGTIQTTFKCQSSGFNHMALSPDGRTLAASIPHYRNAGAMLVRTYLWETTTGRQIALLEKAGGALAFTPDSKLLVTTGLGSVAVWDNNGRERVRLADPQAEAPQPAFSPDSRTLFLIADKQTAGWNIATDLSRMTLPASRFLNPTLIALAFSSDGRTLLTLTRDERGGSMPAECRLFDPATGQLRHTLKNVGWSTAFAPDGRTVMTTRHRVAGLLRFDVQTGAELEAPQPAGSPLSQLTHSPDSRRLASVSPDSMCQVWDLTTQRELASFPCSNMAYAPDGQTLVAAHSGRATLRNGETGAEIWSVSEGHAPVLFAPDGKLLITCSIPTQVTSRLHLRDPATGTELARLDLKDRVYRFLFTPDSQTLIVHFGGKVGLWRIAWRAEPEQSSQLVVEAVTTLNAFPLQHLAVSPDGRVLATSGLDGSVRLWDLVTGQERAQIGGSVAASVSLAFSPDSRTLVTGSDRGVIKLWGR
jgi:WD40 repeat protein